MDKLPPNAQRLLEVMRNADDPSAAERARSDAALREVLSRHGVRDLPQLRSSGAASGTLAKRGLLSLKLGAGALALFVVGAAYLGMRSTRSSPGTTRSLPPMAATTQVAERPVVNAPPTAPEPAVVLRVEQHRTATFEHAAPRREHRAAKIATGTSDAHAASGVDEDLQSELRTVAAADELIRGRRFSEALQLLRRTEPSTGVLREERTALQILARCGLSPELRVLRERDRFLKTWPRSVLAERVRNACETTAE